MLVETRIVPVLGARARSSVWWCGKGPRVSGGTRVGGASSAASGAGVFVIDASGIIFNALRSARMGVALWRVTGRSRLPELAGFGLAVIASYDRPDWALVSRLVDRVPTVIVSSAPEDEQAARAVALGAFGYVPSTISPEALRRAILGALQGEPAYSRRLLADRLRVLTKPQFSGNALALTPRQREVLTLIAKGAADKEVARNLGISTATAQKHVTNLLRRLNVPNRAAAAAVLVSSTTWIPSPGLPVASRADLLRSAS